MQRKKGNTLTVRSAGRQATHEPTYTLQLIQRMSSDGFLPASATSAKAKKLAKLQQNRPAPAASSTSHKAKGKGKGKAKDQAIGGAAAGGDDADEPHLLSTQPNAAGDDDQMDDIERLPLDAGVAPRTSVHSARAGDADAAMNGAQQAGDDDEDDDAVMIDPSNLPTPVVRTPIAQLEAAALASGGDPNTLSFGAITQHNASGLTQRRKIAIPPHRMTPLKRDWIKIYTPLVEECGLQVRMNVGKRQVEMKVRIRSVCLRRAGTWRTDSSYADFEAHAAPFCPDSRCRLPFGVLPRLCRRGRHRHAPVRGALHCEWRIPTSLQ